PALLLPPPLARCRPRHARRLRSQAAWKAPPGLALEAGCRPSPSYQAHQADRRWRTCAGSASSATVNVRRAEAAQPCQKEERRDQSELAAIELPLRADAAEHRRVHRRVGVDEDPAEEERDQQHLPVARPARRADWAAAAQAWWLL